MKFKKTICTLLVLCMALTMVPVTAGATQATFDGYCGDNLTWSFDEATGTLTISGTGEMDNWAFTGAERMLEPWLEYEEEDILSVVINEGVTRIGDYAFSSCYNLSQVSIPSTLTSIGDGAFYDCDSLTSFVIPDTVTQLEKSIFGHCSNLTEATLPKGIAEIPEGTFEYCKSLTSYVIPDTVTSISYSAFANCYNLQSITIPNSVTTIESHAFAYCSSLPSITLPENLVEMGSSVFEGCLSLTEITVPLHVSKLVNTFEGATGTQTIKFLGNFPDCASSLFSQVTATVYYPSNNITWTEDVLQNYGGNITWVGYEAEILPDPSHIGGTCGNNLTWTMNADGVLTISGTGPMWDFSSGSHPWNAIGDSITGVVMEPGVTSIGTEAFSMCGKLTSIDIPNTVTRIGTAAFYMSGLTSVVIPNSVTEFGDSIFWDSALAEVTLPSNMTEIPEGMFHNCHSLTAIKIPERVTSIGANAFLNTFLTQVTIPNNVSYIGHLAFGNYWYGKQPEFTFTGDAPELAEEAFGYLAPTICYPAGNGTWDEAIASYVPGENVFVIWVSYIAETTPMYRLYNPYSGEHFYTGSAQERETLITAGWQYEGIAWNAPIKDGDPVYRLYNPNSGDHHYTMSAEEKGNLVSAGWQYEGVAWNSASADNIPLYRLYNPNADCGSHHYTGSTEERDYLASLGWVYEGIGWFGMLK